MALQPGSRRGAYEIVGPIGAGGMGEVYRGRDTRLKREVAIKVLPDAFTSDLERLARFQREAELLATLNHPNIAQIYGLEDHALILELVVGPTLADRIRQGPIPVDEALPIARQIAEALESAHDRGVIHRDLKPANVKLKADGTVKVLDFGLAKALDNAADAGAMAAHDLSQSPTITSPAKTMGGVILGTAAYMSPEQARGRPLDKRADIWAFGCVLAEMLTGHPVFGGDTVSETLAGVMRDEPHLDQLPAAMPHSVRTLLARCLERDQRRRLRDIGEARIALDQAIAPSNAVGGRSGDTPGSRRRQVQHAVPWIVAAGVVAAALGFFLVQRPSIATTESLELEIGPPPDAQFLIESNSGNVSLSPDGTRIVFRAATSTREALWIRSLGRDDAKPLAGTEGARYPFWAPDSRRLAFFTGDKLKTLDLGAGLPQSIADAVNARGGSWSDDDVILFATGFGTIARVPARGGTPQQVTRLDANRGENAHYWPVILPGGRKFLYFVRSVRLENSGIYAAAIDGSDSGRVVSSLSSGIYAPPLGGRPGYLLWAQNGDLLAQPFDAESVTLSGQPATIASGVRVLEAQRGLMAGVSRTGVLAWATSRATSSRMTWFARDGRRLDTLPIDAQEAMQPRISPDGRRLAFAQALNGTADIHVYDFAARTLRRVTQSPDYDEWPVWSPDSAELLHRSNDLGMPTLMRVRIDGSAPPVELIRQQGGRPLTPVAWSPDRRYFLFLEPFVPGLGAETMIFPADDPKKITPLLTGPANDAGAVFSPDGRWIAFTSDRSGRPDAYVVRFRGDQSPPALVGHPVQISSGGAGVLGWRRDGKELLLVTQGEQIMVVAMEMKGEMLSASQPVPLFPLPPGHRFVEISPDADRFLITEFPYAAGQTIHVLTNWHERIK
jgi:eukaryotic-like serine/threonine-protein kinase